jgi:chemotaxis protein MotB
MTTAYYLILNRQLDPERVSVAGYAEYRPLAPNSSDENRARNRRVDIVIVTDVPHEEKQSLQHPTKEK